MPARIEMAARDLDRILGFFPRVDAKATALFAIDSALLAVMSTHLRADHLKTWYILLPAILATAAIIASLAFIYVCSFPHLGGGAGSLVYFREIAARTESQFANEFESVSDEERLQDLICQVWRNSEILRIKFDSIKAAFIWTAVALAPWCWFLATSSWS